jgi:CHAD domain-containing protein
VSAATSTPRATLERDAADPCPAPQAVPSGPFLTERLRALDGRLASVVARLLAEEDREVERSDAVHDLRVALRRARTVLEVGRRVLGRFHADTVLEALREVQRVAGALRDEEVLLEKLAEHGADVGDTAPWFEARKRRERRLRSALVRAVRAGALERSRSLLAALLLFPVKPSRERRLDRLARRAVARARRKVQKRRRSLPEDSDGLHRLRVAYKRLRYTVDALASALPSDAVALAPAAARMQGRLGEIHDVDVALTCVRRARLLDDAARARLVAALEADRAARLAAYERETSATPSP